MKPETKNKLYAIGFCIFFMILILILIFKIVPELIPPSYTIQDIHHWCCNNLNSTLSPTGDNCTNVINNIYGGKC